MLSHLRMTFGQKYATSQVPFADYGLMGVSTIWDSERVASYVTPHQVTYLTMLNHEQLVIYNQTYGVY